MDSNHRLSRASNQRAIDTYGGDQEFELKAGALELYPHIIEKLL
jgi:hypothetical protein